MFRSESRTSQKIGLAPACSTTFAVAGQVIGLVITSSPGPMPAATRERCNAAVPDATATACRAPVSSANRSSSSAARGPLVSQPDRNVSETASISASSTAGGWNERNSSRTGVVTSGDLCIRCDELYELGSAIRALERLGPGTARREHRAGAVRSARQRPEDPACPAVHPDLGDSLDRGRLLKTANVGELALRGDEKAHAGAAAAARARASRGSRREPQRA